MRIFLGDSQKETAARANENTINAAEKKTVSEQKIGLSAPWYTYYNSLKALFGKDPDITISPLEDDDDLSVKMSVANAEKASAIAKLLPEDVTFGARKMKVLVVSEDSGEDATVDLYRKAFSDNPVVSRIETVNGGIGKFSYVVFKPEVVQYYNDNLGDINGNRTALYEELAKEIFNSDINFCTDKM